METDNDSWHLSKIDESLLNKSIKAGLNLKVNSNINLDSNYDADNHDFSPTDGSDYKPENMISKKKKVLETLSNATETNCNQKEVSTLFYF